MASQATYLRHMSPETHIDLSSTISRTVSRRNLIQNIIRVHAGAVTVASYQSSVEEHEPEYLPYPATKLIIAQYWHCSRNPPFWGWLIVGTFYDQHNNIVWSTEIFAFQRDTRGDRRDSQSTASLALNITSPSLSDQFSRSLNFPQESVQPDLSTYLPPAQNLWDPIIAGSVPGNWLTEYDPRLGNWVNTWHPNYRFN
ncbi:hypothetical protein CCHL11_05634 [Colletotrichum chlorophyti]|uniref:Uncharacterized protein n=1 Tax=Colletotrichum chlorophyti TaxID=708187 RepID=A0A1Q8RTM2_9PEZI|nr:hypothetical protein CCHL11_05634 [Colletotrichum chlorophyti]